MTRSPEKNVRTYGGPILGAGVTDLVIVEVRHQLAPRVGRLVVDIFGHQPRMDRPHSRTPRRGSRPPWRGARCGSSRTRRRAPRPRRRCRRSATRNGRSPRRGARSVRPRTPRLIAGRREQETPRSLHVRARPAGGRERLIHSDPRQRAREDHAQHGPERGHARYAGAQLAGQTIGREAAIVGAERGAEKTAEQFAKSGNDRVGHPTHPAGESLDRCCRLRRAAR